METLIVLHFSIIFALEIVSFVFAILDRIMHCCVSLPNSVFGDIILVT